jgi:hypothetical protein
MRGSFNVAATPSASQRERKAVIRPPRAGDTFSDCDGIISAHCVVISASGFSRSDREVGADIGFAAGLLSRRLRHCYATIRRKSLTCLKPPKFFILVPAGLGLAAHIYRQASRWDGRWKLPLGFRCERAPTPGRRL